MSYVAPVIYADASPLIALARIDRLDLLQVLPLPVRVTATVWQEVAGSSTWPGVVALDRARAADVLVVVDEGDPRSFLPLGPGEAATLSTASITGAAVLLDDLPARRLLQRDPVLRSSIASYLGTISLVVMAKDRGLIGKVRPVLDSLRGQRLRMSPRLYEDALRRVGEWPL